MHASEHDLCLSGVTLRALTPYPNGLFRYRVRIRVGRIWVEWAAEVYAGPGLGGGPCIRAPSGETRSVSRENDMAVPEQAPYFVEHPTRLLT